MEFDFGLTALGTRFHMDWWHDGPDPAAVVRGWAELVAVDEAGREEIRLVHRDVRLLLGSPLADEEIHTLWRAAAAYYPVDPVTPRGRAWLSGIDRVLCTVAAAGPAPVRGGSDVDAVVRLAHALHQEYELPLEPIPVDVVRNAVIRCAEDVDSDLAFRFLLHAYAAYGTPVPASRHVEFRRISESLGHGEFMLAAIDYLTE